MGALLQSMFGIGCLLLGIVVNELVRRSNRIEAYAKDVFDKRFSVYEGLWKLINDAKPIADSVIEDGSLSAEARHQIVSNLVLDIAQFCDENALYLNEDVTVHSCTIYMGIEDIATISDAKERDSALSHFYGSYRAAREIIRAETGLQRLDALFRKVTKAKYSSGAIQCFRQEKAKRYGSGDSNKKRTLA
jgi:hypothetical protein